jgi:hypothetical protein
MTTASSAAYHFMRKQRQKEAAPDFNTRCQEGGTSLSPSPNTKIHTPNFIFTHQTLNPTLCGQRALYLAPVHGRGVCVGGWEGWEGEIYGSGSLFGGRRLREIRATHWWCWSCDWTTGVRAVNFNFDFIVRVVVNDLVSQYSLTFQWQKGELSCTCRQIESGDLAITCIPQSCAPYESATNTLSGIGKASADYFENKFVTTSPGPSSSSNSGSVWHMIVLRLARYSTNPHDLPLQASRSFGKGAKSFQLCWYSTYPRY